LRIWNLFNHSTKSVKPDQLELMPTAFVDRAIFIDKILESREGELLEIGPLNRPMLQGSYVKYFDLLPTDALKLRAATEGLDPTSVPEINYFNENGSLLEIKERFHGVMSSHCLEHQPDLIRHLNEVSALLSGNDSRYYVVVPDKRYCFDALLPESGTCEVMSAYENRLVKPSIWKVIEHRAFTTHNDSVRHWQGDSGCLGEDLKEKVNLAIAEFHASQGKYIDVHCWQFTPQSFMKVMNDLYNLKLIEFTVEEIFETSPNSLEFYAILKKTLPTQVI
jgi:hypothetical protein